MDKHNLDTLFIPPFTINENTSFVKVEGIDEYKLFNVDYCGVRLRGMIDYIRENDGLNFNFELKKGSWIQIQGF